MQLPPPQHHQPLVATRFHSPRSTCKLSMQSRVNRVKPAHEAGILLSRRRIRHLESALSAGAPGGIVQFGMVVELSTREEPVS